MGGAADQLKHLVNAKDRIIEQEKAFLPQGFGQHSEPKNITTKIIKNKVQLEVDLQENADIIAKRQLDDLYEKLGFKLKKGLTPAMLKLNPRLA